MGPQVIAIAPERAMVQALLTRLRARRLGEGYLPWPTEPPGGWPAVITAACAVAALPILGGREIVSLLDLVHGSPALAVAVVAGRVTDEPDTIGLFSALAGRSLVVDLRGNVVMGDSHAGRCGEFPRHFWDRVIDLVTARISGCWEMTDDGVLVAAPCPPVAAQRTIRSRPRSGENALPARSPLDGAGRIR